MFQSKKKKVKASILRDSKAVKKEQKPKVDAVKHGHHQWWRASCLYHGVTNHSTAWGGGCIECAKATMAAEAS